ncbi:MAG: hypothetical protein OEZ06_32345, partial [Myxococcales bacterium]|nr:hypothetical protein [Myxococcales bacterium]
GSWFDRRFAGTRIPTLEQVFSFFATSPVLYVLDIKEARVVPALVEQLRRHGAEGRTVFAAKKLPLLEQIHAQAPEIPSLYFMADIDEVDGIEVPSIHYLRVPKALESDPEHARRIREAGFEPVISAGLLSNGEHAALAPAVLADNVARAVAALGAPELP